MVSRYRTRAIISLGLYIFTPLFTAAYIVERLVLQTILQCTKQGNSSIFSLKSMVFNQEWIIMARVR
jgi:hypothetical protein